jgi:deazaflavin-dependent oxidoreductase (nitroreductase family)
MPSDLVLKGMNAVHRLVLRLTRGRLGHAAAGMPVLELTTTGRRTGAARSVLLTSPMRDGAAYVVVASRGGDDRHPDWYLNLRADPDVRVAVQGGPPVPMRAVIADPEQRARLWPAVVRTFPHYGGYQRRTEREIPLVLLTPPG